MPVEPMWQLLTDQNTAARSPGVYELTVCGGIIALTVLYDNDTNGYLGGIWASGRQVRAIGVFPTARAAQIAVLHAWIALAAVGLAEGQEQLKALGVPL